MCATPVRRGLAGYLLAFVIASWLHLPADLQLHQRTELALVCQSNLATYFGSFFDCD